MDKLPEIFGFKAEVPLADGIGGEGVELFDPRADDEFRERARLVQRLRGGLRRPGGGDASGVSAEAGTGGAMSPNRSSMMSCALAALPTLGCGTGACSFSRMSRFST